MIAPLLLAATAACAGPERTEPPVPEDVYVDVMARLSAVRAAREPGAGGDRLSASAADSLRRAVLRQHGLDRADLKEFARVVGDEPERMEALWKRIAAASDSLVSAGWPASGDGTGEP